MYQNLVTEVDHEVGIITLSRPDRHNAFDDVTVVELIQALAEMEADAAVRVVVLSSAGRTFCAGAEENFRDAKVIAEMLKKLARLSKPTVARVQGSAQGAGLGLVAACDVAIATFDAQFSLLEARLGLVPAVVGPYFVAAIGERHARRYMLTAEQFSAAEAYRIGLIHEMVADEPALDQAVGQVVEALLQGGPQAMAECKALVRDLAGRPITDEVVADTVVRAARRRSSEEAREGMAAFLAKRPPAWARSD